MISTQGIMAGSYYYRTVAPSVLMAVAASYAVRSWLFCRLNLVCPAVSGVIMICARF